MSLRNVLFAAFALLSAGFARADGYPELQRAPRRPLKVIWSVESKEPGKLVGVARVEAAYALDVPVKATVLVPKGAEVAAGDVSFTLPAGELAVERRITLTYAATPKQDLIVRAEALGKGFALRARDTYRFGRAEPQPAVAPADGPRLKIGKRDLGASNAAH